MLRFTLLAFVALIFTACGSEPSETPAETSAEVAATETGFAGDWSTDLETPNGVILPLVLHITEDESGAYAATLDSPDQGAFGIEATRVLQANDTLAIEFAVIAAEFMLSREGDTLLGEFTQGATIPVTFTPAEDTPPPARPQEEALVRDYQILPVTFPGGAPDVTLAGELTIPNGDGPFPAAVLISGSGPQDRNEELMAHKPFLILSDHLTKSGYAVLRYDDRGTAESTGDHDAATTQDFATDAAAALAFLRDQTGIDATHAGYIGHSEGGLIAPLATQIEEADFMVLLAGPAVPLSDVILQQSRDIAAAQGAPEQALAAQDDILTRVFEAMRASDGMDGLSNSITTLLVEDGAPEAQAKLQTERFATNWMYWAFDYDPVPALEAYEGPVLGLFGETDLQVSAEASAPVMKAALSHPSSTIKTLDGLNHLFQPSETGLPGDYAKIETTFDEGALAEISNWLDQLN